MVLARCGSILLFPEDLYEEAVSDEFGVAFGREGDTSGGAEFSWFSLGGVLIRGIVFVLEFDQWLLC